MPAEPAATPQARSDYLPTVVAVGLYVVVILRAAWLSDDAYITFRTVDNFVNGYGLTWNVAERVQVCTHPLWMFLLSGVYLLSHKLFYFTSILLCVLFSVVTVLFFTTRVAVGSLAALIGTTVFILSKAFVDYSTSGLENPLTHFLLMLFLFVYLTRPASRKTLLWLSLLAGLLTFNRMDAVLLVLPALCVAFYHVRGLRALGAVVLGFAPFLAWEAFALFYYGSLLPNTAYAKLNTGVPAGELIRHGLLYLVASVRLEPLTPTVIVAGLAVPFLIRQYRHVPLVLGALLYLLYLLYIGGDFMLGRFLTAPLLIAVVLLSRVTLSTRTGVIMLVLIALIGLVPARSPLRSDEDYAVRTGYPVDKNGISDERAFYYQGTGLLRASAGVDLPNDLLVTRGRRARARGAGVIVTNAIGMHGFFAGPRVHIVDKMALADPLLARLKPEIDEKWRIGHYRRRIPPGYLETLRTGKDMFADPRLAEYYEKVQLITRGELWDPQRWLEIVRFNLGAYDHLLAAVQP